MWEGGRALCSGKSARMMMFTSAANALPSDRAAKCSEHCPDENPFSHLKWLLSSDQGSFSCKLLHCKLLFPNCIFAVSGIRTRDLLFQKRAYLPFNYRSRHSIQREPMPDLSRQKLQWLQSCWKTSYSIKIHGGRRLGIRTELFGKMEHGGYKKPAAILGR